MITSGRMKVGQSCLSQPICPEDCDVDFWDPRLKVCILCDEFLRSLRSTAEIKSTDYCFPMHLHVQHVSPPSTGAPFPSLWTTQYYTIFLPLFGLTQGPSKNYFTTNWETHVNKVNLKIIYKNLTLNQYKIKLN